MRASIIVPTYDHGPLLEHAVGSALAQTEQDLEVIVVGDGIPDAVRPVVERVVASDPRIRFLDRPKGPEHGFRHRDEAIREARADLILYLADDDLWFPDHVELLCSALEEVEFAASLPLSLTRAEIRIKVLHDLGKPRWKRRLLECRSTISLATVGHTRVLYERLRTGWRRDDALYGRLWRDFAQTASSLATVPRVTALILPDTKRGDMTPEERLAEISELARVIREPAGRLGLIERMLEFEVRRWSALALDAEAEKERSDEKRARVRRRRQLGKER